MRIKQASRALATMALGALFVVLFLSAGLYSWHEALMVAEYAWIPLIITLLSLVFLFGKKSFAQLSNKEKIQPDFVRWCLQIVMTQMVFLFILFAFGVVSVLSYLDVAPELGQTPQSVISEFISTKQVIWNFYPFALASFFAILFGVVAPPSAPKVGNTLPVLFGRPLPGLVTSSIDFFCTAGLFLGFLFITALVAILFGSLVGAFLNIDMHFGLTYRTAAVGFILSYLPFTDIWKELIDSLTQIKKLSPAAVLLILGLGIGLFFPFIIKLIGWFIGIVLKQDLGRSFVFPYVLNMEPLPDLSLMIWMVSVLGASWWGMSLALYSRGRKIGEFLVVSSVLPLVLCGIVYSTGVVNSPESLKQGLTPLLVFPGGVLIGLLACFIILWSLRENSTWLESLFLILPNQVKKKNARLKQIIASSASWVLYSMLLWIYVGMFALQGIFLGFLLSSVISVALIMLGVQKVVWCDTVLKRVSKRNIRG